MNQLPAVTKLILFDIDGTLVLTGGAGRRALSRAFEDLFALPDCLNGVPMSGRTDAWIIGEVAARHGLPMPPCAIDQLRTAYVSHLQTEIQEPGPSLKGVMPGILPLLQIISGRNDGYLALLTGNFEQGARIKLEYFDLWRYFPCGGFGDDAPDRNSLLGKAIARVAECGGPAVEPKDVVIVGDTPLDVAVAVAGGARSVAVATGGYDVDTLWASGADAVFEDLSDVSAVLGAFGFGEIGTG
jgi:phosphoglycolate phosphatase